MKIFIFLLLSSLLINSFDCSFQSKLFSRMNKKKIGENLIISPLSIFQALSLTANGAKKDTLSEMLGLLEASSLDELNQMNYKILSIIKKFKTIDIANAVMSKFTPLANFAEVAENYSALVEPLKSVEQVNNWCSKKTHGKIKNILSSLDPSIVMIILNAIYFKDEWSSKFYYEFTEDLPFYNLGNIEKKVKTMSQVEYSSYYEDKKVQAIKLGFSHDDMYAIIILPAEGTDINKYINTLSNSNDEYNKIINGFKSVKVHLELPKFEVHFSENLKQILMNLGMYNAFYPEHADFTGLRKEGELYISEVIHKTYLKVDEKGTEGAAITEVIIQEYLSDEPEKIYNMKVNRPFLFLLKNGKLPAGYDLLFISKIEKIKYIY